MSPQRGGCPLPLPCSPALLRSTGRRQWGPVALPPAGDRPTHADRRLLLRLGLVPLHVQRQVVGAAECAVAGLADERLGAGVLTDVSGQLVRAGEAPVAVLPGAEVRLLS